MPPTTYPGSVRKMDGGRNRDGQGFGPFADSDQPWGVVFHTTETAGVPSYRRDSISVAPHFTYDAPRRKWYQHVELNRRAGTLVGSSTSEAGKRVPTNAAKVIQVEIVCYSNKSIADRYGRLWVGALTDDHKNDLAAFISWAVREFRIIPRWYTKPRPYGTHPMSHRDWWYDRTWGVCEHATAPDDSTHWDCGAIDAAGIMRRVGFVKPAVRPADAVIDWAFASGLAQGDPQYWKNLDPRSPEWSRFIEVLRGGWIGWAFEHGAVGDPGYWLGLDPRSAEWSDLFRAVETAP